jgi:Protein of unknown function (DUF3164)
MSQNATNTVPDGYMQDTLGRLVPIEMVKEIDRERDALVREIVGNALPLAGELAQFKGRALDDIQAFVELSAERYQAKLGGTEGNVQLTTYDGHYKIRRDIAKLMEFDERMQAAKALIDECLHEWTADSRAEIRALINDAFQVDRAGKISVDRVLGLRRLDIQDPRWQRAMTAIGESLQVVGRKAYLRLYQRNRAGGYDLISLDVATSQGGA